MLYDCLLLLAALLSIRDDDATVITLNCFTKLQRLESANAIAIATTHAIADTRTTSISSQEEHQLKTNIGRTIQSQLAYLT
jgi:hypothetical protein